jgi:hypothetical protein
MRTLSIALLAALTLLAAASVTRAHAAAAPPPGMPPALLYQQKQVDQHADTRVAVQLVVLGTAAVVVVVIGTGAYFLRKRLGLTAAPPEQGADGHH